VGGGREGGFRYCGRFRDWWEGRKWDKKGFRSEGMTNFIIA
jgi:hypothetical protein